ncbi:MAG: Arm DNA-binding domain-containing protein [Acidimicrobiales bacterium]
MHGRLLKRNGSWTYVVDIGRDGNGRRLQQSRRGFPTRKAAVGALAEVIAAINRGTYRRPSPLTLAECLTDWWEPFIEGQARPTTAASYRMHCRRYLVPRVGSVRLTDLDATRINAFYAHLVGPDNGAGALSPRTVRLIHATLHRSLQDAVR